MPIFDPIACTTMCVGCCHDRIARHVSGAWRNLRPPPR
jgi:hypothetical protein